MHGGRLALPDVQNQNGGNSLFKSLKRSAKGANVPHAKATAGLATVKMPTPEHVIIPMSMHIGAPAEPVVKKGDTVMVGTLIGKAGGFVGANIFSSVSGTVQDVAPMRMVNGSMTTAVAIKTDGAQTIDPACVPPTVTDKASLLAAVHLFLRPTSRNARAAAFSPHLSGNNTFSL